MKKFICSAPIIVLLGILNINSANSQTEGQQATNTPTKDCPTTTLSFIADIGAQDLDDAHVKNDKEAVNSIQTSLISLGYDPGVEDGIVGSKTREAIRHFECEIGRKETGAVTQLLLVSLRSAESGEQETATTINFLSQDMRCETFPFLEECKKKSGATSDEATPVSNEDHETIDDYKPFIRYAPVYPSRAQSRGIEGYVDMRLTVTATGTVKDPVVLFSTSSLFDDAATRAVLKFRYRPRVVDGLPVEVQNVKTRIKFELEK